MKTDARLDCEAILSNELTPIHLVISVTGDELPESVQPKPAAFCAVIDNSGSMAGDPLAYAKEAARVALRNLRSEDLFSVVTFSDRAQVRIPLQKPGDREAMARRILEIDDEGSTNLTAGWALGRDELAKAAAGMARRLLLLTDGHLNVGIVDPGMVRGVVSEGLERRGIRTSCLGFGDGYDEDLLRDLATVTGGEFHDASSVDKLPGIFGAELGGLQRISAQNVRVRVRRRTFCDSLVLVSSYPVVGLPDGASEITIGDLIAGETRTLVLGMVVLPLPLPLLTDGAPAASLEGEELLELEFAWDEVGSSEIRSCRETQVIRVLRVQDPADVRRVEEVIAAVAYQRAGKAVCEGVAEADAGRLDDACAKLEGAIGQLREYGGDRANDSIRLIESSLRQLRVDEGMTLRSRKMHQYKASKLRRMSTQSYWSADEEAPEYTMKPPTPSAQNGTADDAKGGPGVQGTGVEGSQEEGGSGAGPAA